MGGANQQQAEECEAGNPDYHSYGTDVEQNIANETGKYTDEEPLLSGTLFTSGHTGILIAGILGIQRENIQGLDQKKSENI